MNEIGRVGDMMGVFVTYPKIWMVKNNEVGVMAPHTFFTQWLNFEDTEYLISTLKLFISAN